MTAVANLPSLQPNNRPRWDIRNGQVTCDPINADKVARRFASKKIVQRPKTLPAITCLGTLPSSAATNQSKFPVNGASMPTPAKDNGTWATTGAKKKASKPEPWLNRRSNSISDFKVPSTRPSAELSPNELMVRSPRNAPSSQWLQSIPLMNSSQKSSSNRSQSQASSSSNPPVLCLVSMNGTFDRKRIPVPLYPESVRIGRQTNIKTMPTPENGYFDSKVLSRQHAELWSDKNGIIWIKDIKSSNGTFVNGARLSPENRESEAHELETHDQLDLGIDIVSEDQKTVVHHKVAAKVEYAGFVETVNTIEFDDFDNTNCTNVALSQGQIQIRGRNELHNLNSNVKRSGTAASNTNSLISLGQQQQQQLKFWITPITVEQIVKRLTNEMRMARLQTNELRKTHDFLGSLLEISKIEQVDKPMMKEAMKPSVFLNSMTRPEPATCFSAPPAPPPQLPLPEKPEFARSTDYQSQNSHTKRVNTERSTLIPAISQAHPGTPNQVVSLMEALAVAKKEIDSQNEKMRELEDLLMKEKKSREYAEYIVKQLESQSEHRKNELLTVSLEKSVMEEAFEPFGEDSKQKKYCEPELISQTSKVKIETTHDNESTNPMESCLETIFAEMGEFKGQLETCDVYTEIDMAERDADQRTLAEMVEKIRLDEAERSKKLQDEFGCYENRLAESNRQEANSTPFENNQQDFQPRIKPRNSWTNEDESKFGILAKDNNYHEPFLSHHAAPFASMLGIVLIGVGIMSYLNGWHIIKGER